MEPGFLIKESYDQMSLDRCYPYPELEEKKEGEGTSHSVAESLLSLANSSLTSG